MADNKKDFLDLMGTMGKAQPQTKANLTNEYQPGFVDLMKTMGTEGHMSYDPNFSPQGKFTDLNTTDFSHINVDGEVLNNLGDDMLNSLKRGIDSIQIMTAQGKLNYDPFGNAPQEIIDLYPDDLKKLQSKLESGEINQDQFDVQKASLDQNLSLAQDKKAQFDRDIQENVQEISNEPVSKEYMLKQYLTQAQGDAGTF